MKYLKYKKEMRKLKLENQRTINRLMDIDYIAKFQNIYGRRYYESNSP